MPAHPLSSIPVGADLFLDADVLIYGLSGRSPQCRRLLHRCASEEVNGVTSAHIIGEITHRLMCEEAKSKGLAGSQAAKTLGEHPERVKQLADYWKDVHNLLTFNLLLVAVDEHVLLAAHVERHEYGLLHNDSLVVACMRLYGISMLASHDAVFQQIAGVTVFAPTDL
ncbi:MAG: PIN domain-containing protein [Terriglobales bacterium]|jgi:predicted nucleic acid-binding protein